MSQNFSCKKDLSHCIFSACDFPATIVCKWFYKLITKKYNFGCDFGEDQIE